MSGATGMKTGRAHPMTKSASHKHFAALEPERRAAWRGY